VGKKDQTRRKFIGNALGLCVAGPEIVKNFANSINSNEEIFPIRKGRSNPYMKNGKPVVVIIRGSNYLDMLEKGMAELGGFSKFGNPNSIIIKPNFVFDKRTKYPTTTDINSILSTIDHLKREGYTNITVADRRAKRVNGRAGGKFEWSGLNKKAETGGFTTDSLMDNGVAEAVQVKNDKWKEMPAIGVLKKVYDTDLIINMPTLKRHSITNLTCSLKNMMGVLDADTTNNMHLWGEKNKARRESMPKDEVTKRLCRTIAEAAMAVNPDMTIIDARKILCKDHLSVGTGMPKEANCLIISGDSLAADICAAKILKEVYPPYELGFTKDTFVHASELGIGVANPDNFILKEIVA